MKRIIILFSILCGVNFSYAQEQSSDESSAFNFTAGLQSNHLWRGLIISDKPVVTGQAWFNLNKSKTVQLGIWGGTAISNESDDTHYKEINYYLQYSNNGLTIGIWDLYNSRNINTLISVDDIFDYSKKKTAHIIDLRTAYQFKENFPLRLEADFLLYGGANAGEVKLKSDGAYDANKYSTYVQVGYPFIKQEKISFDAFVGAGFAFNPGDVNKGESTYLYGNGENKFDVVNIGFTASKNIKVFNTEIPVSLTTMWNPSNKYARVQVATRLF